MPPPGNSAGYYRSEHGGRARGASGFTLLEVMVAMVILTLIMTSSFGALRLGERSWEIGAQRAGENETLRAVTELLRRQFRQALRVTWNDGKTTRIAFEGTRTGVSFIAPAPRHIAAGGLFEYRLAVEGVPGDEQSLVLYYRRHDPDLADFGRDDNDTGRTVLLEALGSAAFAYYGAPLKDDDPKWRDQWDSEADNMPTLVRVSLADTSDREPWPELLLALHTEQFQ